MSAREAQFDRATDLAVLFAQSAVADGVDVPAICIGMITAAVALAEAHGDKAQAIEFLHQLLADMKGEGALTPVVAVALSSTETVAEVVDMDGNSARPDPTVLAAPYQIQQMTEYEIRRLLHWWHGRDR